MDININPYTHVLWSLVNTVLLRLKIWFSGSPHLVWDLGVEPQDEERGGGGWQKEKEEEKEKKEGEEKEETFYSLAIFFQHSSCGSQIQAAGERLVTGPRDPSTTGLLTPHLYLSSSFYTAQFLSGVCVPVLHGAICLSSPAWHKYPVNLCRTEKWIEVGFQE